MNTDNEKIEKSIDFVARHYKADVCDAAKNWAALGIHRDMRLWWMGTVAAVAAVLICAGIWVFRMAESQSQWCTFTAETETRLLLPDSSVVLVAAGSSISYDKAKFITHRNVDISGSATFQVSRDAGHPFRVHASVATVEVLGTQFAVIEENADSALLVDVISGKVKVYNDCGDVILTAGMQACADHSGVKVLTPHAGSVHLSFSNALLADVVADIENSYGVIIRNVPDAEYRISLEYEGDASSLIATVNELLGTSLEMEGGAE